MTKELTAREALEKAAVKLGERVDSLVIMCDRAGYTREGSDLSQRVSATREAMNLVRALAAELPEPLPDTFTLRAMMPKELHPATKALVFNFACALADKLYHAEQKYGYSDGWLADNWMDECRAKLREHVQKGDPRDVAAYCAFLWHHKQPTTVAASLPEQGGAGKVQEGWKLVHAKPVAWRREWDGDDSDLNNWLVELDEDGPPRDNHQWDALYSEYGDDMLAAAPSARSGDDRQARGRAAGR